ncbi:MAG: hypothetical protein OXC91_12030, partial [Rhodobacteraceae bacterium]|nr:hypothetical protein [Paracoccaceae bacterium]
MHQKTHDGNDQDGADNPPDAGLVSLGQIFRWARDVGAASGLHRVDPLLKARHAPMQFAVRGPVVMVTSGQSHADACLPCSLQPPV